MITARAAPVDDGSRHRHRHGHRHGHGRRRTARRPDAAGRGLHRRRRRRPAGRRARERARPGPLQGRHRRRRRRGRLRVPVRARPQRRRVPGAEHLPALPGQAAVPEPARSRTPTSTTTATAYAAARSTASGTRYGAKPGRRPARRRLPPVLLRRRAVLAERPRRRHGPPHADARTPRRYAKCARVPGAGPTPTATTTCSVAERPGPPWYDAPGSQSFDIRDVNRNGDGRRRRPHRLPRAEDVPYDIDGDGCDLRRRARRGRRRPHQLRRARAAAMTPELLDQRATTSEKPVPDQVRRHRPRRPGHRRRRHPRRRRRPGPRRHPEHHGAQPQHGLRATVDWDTARAPCNIDDDRSTARRPGRGHRARPLASWHQTTTAASTRSTRASRTSGRARARGTGGVRRRASAPFDGSTDWFALQ